MLQFFRYFSGWVYEFHMPLFFVLSGAVFGLKPVKSFDAICKAKIYRLLFPYYTTGLLFMLPVKYLGCFYTKETILPAIRAFWLGGESGHLWFLLALFWCIIGFSIIIKVLHRLNIHSIYALLLSSGVVAFLRDKLPFDFLGLYLGLSYLFWFTLGYYFEWIRKKYKLDTISLKRLLRILTLLLVIECFNQKYQYLDAFSKTVCGILMTIVLSTILSRKIKTRCSKIWDVLVRNLFCIYLFHDPLEYLILNYAFGKSQLLTTACGVYWYFIMRTIGVFAVSLALGEGIRAIENRVQNCNNKIFKEG